MITYTVLGVPYYNYSTMYPTNPILVIKVPILNPSRARGRYEEWHLHPFFSPYSPNTGLAIRFLRFFTCSWEIEGLLAQSCSDTVREFAWLSEFRGGLESC